MKSRSLGIAALAVAVAIAGLAAPATAVKHGVLDGLDHPYVGLMVAKDSAGQKLWRCTGTLVSPTVFLTAGHCTDAPAASVTVWFDTDVTANADALGYPDAGSLTGTPYTHPLYDPADFTAHDLGVVVLDQPQAMATYGTLPGVDSLDELEIGRSTTFTTVGYGYQKDVGGTKNDQRTVVRMVAQPQLVGINGGQAGEGTLILSNNANTGGTCSGDSGGPNFLGTSNVIAGVTSFGYSQSCGGIGGVYRVDRVDDLDWLGTFGL